MEILQTEFDEIGDPPIITKEQEKMRWDNIGCSTIGIKKLASAAKLPL